MDGPAPRRWGLGENLRERTTRMCSSGALRRPTDRDTMPVRNPRYLSEGEADIVAELRERVRVREWGRLAERAKLGLAQAPVRPSIAVVLVGQV